MPKLWGGAVGPDFEPSPLFPDLDEYELRELARASRTILEQGRPRDPNSPRSRWELRWVDGEGLVEVEVERLPPAGEDA